MSAKYIWGKSDGDHWLPLWLHLSDTISATEHLWDTWLSPHVKRLIAKDLQCSDDESRRVSSWMSGMHDIGKATPDFSGRDFVIRDTELLYSRMRGQGFTYPNLSLREINGKPARHEVMSAGILERIFFSEIHDIDSNPETMNTITSIVAGHHGSPNGDVDYMEVESLLEELSDVWGESQDELVDFVNERTEAFSHVLRLAKQGIPMRTQILLTGILIMSDWLASTEEYFELLPYDNVPDVGDEEYIQKRKEESVSKIDLPSLLDGSGISHEGELTEVFSQRFGFEVDSLTSIQESLLEIVKAPDQEAADVFVVEASMGQGKTEASLLASEILLQKGGYSGVFFGLPTMTTSEAIYNRIVPYTEALAEATNQQFSLSLLHSKDMFSASYQNNRRALGKKVSGECGVIAEGWLRGKRQRVLNSYVVSTIDTFLMMSLKMKYAYWRHLGLASKILILDEIHSSDVYMDVYLMRSIEWAGYYETPVLILTATLSEEKRTAILEAYNRGKEEGLKLWQE